MRKLFAALTCIALVLAMAVPAAFAGRPVDTTPPVTTASPVGGTFNGSVAVTLTRNEAGTTYYTTNGTTPTTASAIYSAPLNFTATTTLKYFSKDTAGNTETVKTQVYTISAATTTHATLTWSGYTMCSSCHASQAQAMYQSVHYQWKGSAAEMTTGPTIQGKMDAVDGSSALNAYCINMATGAPVAPATPAPARNRSLPTARPQRSSLPSIASCATPMPPTLLTAACVTPPPACSSLQPAST